MRRALVLVAAFVALMSGAVPVFAAWGSALLGGTSSPYNSEFTGDTPEAVCAKFDNLHFDAGWWGFPASRMYHGYTSLSATHGRCYVFEDAAKTIDTGVSRGIVQCGAVWPGFPSTVCAPSDHYGTDDGLIDPYWAAWPDPDPEPSADDVGTALDKIALAAALCLCFGVGFLGGRDV